MVCIYLIISKNKIRRGKRELQDTVARSRKGFRLSRSAGQNSPNEISRKAWTLMISESS
jgi:hypothetical protein